MADVTYDELDDLVDTDPIKLRDVAWALVAEVSRLTAAEIAYRKATEVDLRADLARALEVVKAAEAWADLYRVNEYNQLVDERLVAAVDTYRQSTGEAG